jgi:FkbM family methyltransferase
MAKFDPYVRDRNVEGVRFQMLIADEEAREWYDVGTSDPSWPELRFIRDHLVHPGDVVFDCGAHQGSTSIILGALTGPSGSVVAFEPVRYNCERMRANLELNDVKNVRIEHAAAGRKRGTVKLRGGTNAQTVRFGLFGERADQVVLDDYADLAPRLLKIDVEGAEADVLAGAQKLLASTPGLAIEIHTEALTARGVPARAILDLIGPERYDLWIQPDPLDEPRPAESLTFATPNPHLFCVPRP